MFLLLPNPCDFLLNQDFDYIVLDSVGLTRNPLLPHDSNCFIVLTFEGKEDKDFAEFFSNISLLNRILTEGENHGISLQATSILSDVCLIRYQNELFHSVFLLLLWFWWINWSQENTIHQTNTVSTVISSAQGKSQSANKTNRILLRTPVKAFRDIRHLNVFCFSLHPDVSIRGGRDQFDEIQEKKKVHPSLDSVDDDGSHRMERKQGFNLSWDERELSFLEKKRRILSHLLLFCFECSTSFSSSWLYPFFFIPKVHSVSASLTPTKECSLFSVERDCSRSCCRHSLKSVTCVSWCLPPKKVEMQDKRVKWSGDKRSLWNVQSCFWLNLLPASSSHILPIEIIITVV